MSLPWNSPRVPFLDPHPPTPARRGTCQPAETHVDIRPEVVREPEGLPRLVAKRERDDGQGNRSPGRLTSAAEFEPHASALRLAASTRSISSSVMTSGGR